MLAHTSSRHIILGVQLAIGVALLSASYLSDNSLSANATLKAKTQHGQTLEAINKKSERC